VVTLPDRGPGCDSQRRIDCPSGGPRLQPGGFGRRGGVPGEQHPRRAVRGAGSAGSSGRRSFRRQPNWSLRWRHRVAGAPIVARRPRRRSIAHEHAPATTAVWDGRVAHPAAGARW